MAAPNATSNRVQNQGVWIGGGFGTDDDSGPLLGGQVGQVITKAGKSYQRVQFKSTTTTIANGTPVSWTDLINFVVSAKAADQLGGQNLPAGVALGTQTAGNYGWIQVAGPHAAILTKGAVTAAAADALIVDSTDGVVNKVTAGTAPTNTPLAVATAGTSAGATAGVIVAPHNGW